MVSPGRHRDSKAIAGRDLYERRQLAGNHLEAARIQVVVSGEDDEPCLRARGKKGPHGGKRGASVISAVDGHERDSQVIEIVGDAMVDHECFAASPWSAPPAPERLWPSWRAPTTRAPGGTKGARASTWSSSA
ncbi:MAG: hypothetical protein M0Z69_14015 [Actinomycetota bacterium]|nr:hypothetical protein [Actinomycetota bacterium]